MAKNTGHNGLEISPRRQALSGPGFCVSGSLLLVLLLRR